VERNGRFERCRAVIRPGAVVVCVALAKAIDGRTPEVPNEAAKIVDTLSQQTLDTHVRRREIDRDLAVWLRGNDVARRLTTIPGIGPVGMLISVQT
jgi:transposase